MAERKKMLLLCNLQFLLCTFQTLVLLCANGAKLNEPKVLLPYYTGSPSSYRIEINDAVGCFTWTSSRPDVASVTTNDDSGCSNSVTVTSEHRDPSRVTTFLLAENKETGEVLRCDVIVDSITAIGIETTTRELYLEDSPEKFQIWARDSEGNTFSTLDSTAFEWNLVSDEESAEDAGADAHEVLSIIPFRDSNYDTPPHIEAMESNGLQGDTILVEGRKTGSANVQVKLKDKVYKSVPGDEVRLIVIANVILSPPDAYILLSTSLKYRAHVIKQGVMNEIPLPSEQYHLVVKNVTTCSLSSATSEVYGEALGDTQVVLRDKNMPVALLEAFHQPTASIHVVLPAYLGFTVHPGRKWVLESGRVYEISVQVLSKDRQVIHLSKDVRLKTEFVSKHFEVIRSSINGSYHVVRAKAPGRTDIKSVLSSVIRKDGTEYKIKPVVDGVQRADIYDPITVSPDVLVFPWIVPDQGAVYSAQLQARGGSGDYSWTTNDTSVADLSSKTGSTVQVNTKNIIGTNLVTTSDVKNSLHFDTAQVFVMPPEDMMFNPKYVEVEVGSYLHLPLAVFGVFGDVKRSFTDCRQLPLTVTTENSVFVYDADTEAGLPTDGMSCTTVRVLAKRPGHTVVKASYAQDAVNLVASVTIAAFDPLVAVDPTEKTVLAQGSSRALIFRGGPLPWVLDTSQYFENGHVADRKVVTLRVLKGNSAVHRLYGSCVELGDRDVMLTVGNKPTATNKYPATRSASVRIHCKEPAGVSLRPLVPQPENLPPCPVTTESDSPIPAHNYHDLNIDVVVIDDQGQRFDNISSLEFEWKLSDSNLGKLDGKVPVKSSVKRPGEGADAGAISWYQTLSPSKLSGTLTVSLLLNWKLSKDVTLNLVEDAVVQPGDVTLFNHPDNSAVLDILGGSGHFVKKHEPEKLATVEYNEASRQMLVSPALDGNLRVQVLDLCLVAHSEADAIVHISGAHRVQLQIRDKVQKGNSLTASVRVLDHNGKPLPAAHFQLMNLRPKLDLQSQRYISITAVKGQSEDAALFTVKGVALGTARLAFVAQAQRGSVITSNVQDVQVFPPLRLEPRNVTILVGAALGVQAVGGPHPQSSIEYSLLGPHDDVATVSGSGLVETMAVGSVKIRAQAVGTEGEGGQRIVYSEDEGEIHVVKLVGIRLHAPLSRLKTNTRMPVYAMGLTDHETPFSFANVFPPLSFKWSTTNGEVASLQSVYHQSGIELPEESRFSQQLVTRREGHVTVHLQVTVQQKFSDYRLQQVEDNKVISDEVHIQVFDSLELLSPTVCTGQVLMTPNTGARLKTNRDSSASRMTYTVQSGADLLTVQQNGEMMSGTRAGEAAVLVTAVERFGTNQTALILVQVKPVSYVMLNCETEFKVAKSLNFVPVGAVLQYRVSSHDELGQRFDFTNSQLRFRPNRFDLLQVTTSGAENGTVTVRVPRVSPYPWGGTALKVWDVGQPRIADFININVQKAIDSAEFYVVGDVICFTSPLLTSAGEPGVWSTDNRNMLVIDPHSGHALALSPGVVSVSHEVTSQTTTAQVMVRALDDLYLEDGSVRAVTIGKDAYYIPVTINGASKSTCSGNEVSKPAEVYPFKCELSQLGVASQGLPDISQLFEVRPVWHQDTGGYGCSLTPLPLSPSQKSQLSTLQGTLSLAAASHDGEVASQAITLTFLPPADVNAKELYLTAAEPVTHIEISATSATISYLQIKIEGHLSTLVHSSAPVLEGELYKIPIKLSSYNPVSAEGHITLVDKLADVSYSIQVHISAGNGTHNSQSSRLGQLLWNHTDLMIFVIACVVVTTVCLLMGYFAVFGSKNVSTTTTSDAKLFQKSPIHSIGSSPSPQSGDHGSSPWLQQRASGGRVALWSSGYEPQEANQSDITLFKKSPNKMMTPY